MSRNEGQDDIISGKEEVLGKMLEEKLEEEFSKGNWISFLAVDTAPLTDYHEN